MHTDLLRGSALAGCTNELHPQRDQHWLDALMSCIHKGDQYWLDALMNNFHKGDQHWLDLQKGQLLGGSTKETTTDWLH